MRDACSSGWTLSPLAALVICGVALVGCVPDRAPGSDDATFAVPTLSGAGGDDALLEPVWLAGGTVDGSPCLWVEDDAGARISVRWPPGSSGRLDPVALLDSDAGVVARGGDELRLGGSPDMESPPDDCNVGPRYWGAASVERVDA